LYHRNSKCICFIWNKTNLMKINLYLSKLYGSFIIMPTWATTTPFLLRAANTTVFIHSVLANKLSLALKVTGKVTDRDTIYLHGYLSLVKRHTCPVSWCKHTADYLSALQIYRSVYFLLFTFRFNWHWHSKLSYC
jgi:hypothetical protein